MKGVFLLVTFIHCDESVVVCLHCITYYTPELDDSVNEIFYSTRTLDSECCYLLPIDRNVMNPVIYINR